MSFSVTMPQLGESVTEGTVTRWLKNEGDRVEADEPLLEVSTDKVDTEIPSPATGVLSAIKVQQDETVLVGVELAVIADTADGGAPAPAAPVAAAAPAPPAAAEVPIAAAPPVAAPAPAAPAAPAPAPPAPVAAPPAAPVVPAAAAPLVANGTAPSSDSAA